MELVTVELERQMRVVATDEVAVPGGHGAGGGGDQMLVVAT